MMPCHAPNRRHSRFCATAFAAAPPLFARFAAADMPPVQTPRRFQRFRTDAAARSSALLFAMLS